MKPRTNKTFLQKLTPILLVIIVLCCCTVSILSNKGDNQLNKTNKDLNESSSIDIPSYPDPIQTKTYKVTSVVDGDTINIETIGKVRLIGIDAPEISGNKECFSEESKQKLNDILGVGLVEIEWDQSQGEKDIYNRSLLYIFDSNGVNINLELIKQGYSFEYTYDNPYKYQEEFKEAQSYAKLNNLGLWNSKNCNGNRILPVLVEPETPPTFIAPQQNSGFTCNCSKTCSQLSCEEAQFQLNSCGCSARDGDKDGLACDAQCG